MNNKTNQFSAADNTGALAVSIVEKANSGLSRNIIRFF